jgi:hypothetical protein
LGASRYGLVCGAVGNKLGLVFPTPFFSVIHFTLVLLGFPLFSFSLSSLFWWNWFTLPSKFVLVCLIESFLFVCFNPLTVLPSAYFLLFVSFYSLTV